MVRNLLNITFSCLWKKKKKTKVEWAINHSMGLIDRRRPAIPVSCACTLHGDVAGADWEDLSLIPTGVDFVLFYSAFLCAASPMFLLEFPSNAFVSLISFLCFVPRYTHILFEALLAVQSICSPMYNIWESTTLYYKALKTTVNCVTNGKESATCKFSRVEA